VTSAVTIIEPGTSGRRYWRDLWTYRELFYFLAWRDILVRYKQTILGAAWAILRPLLVMIVLTIIFGKVAKLGSDGAPYPLLVFAGMLPWQFFANAFTDAGNSLILNESMVSKIYFPRLMIPASAVIVSFVDFLVAGTIFAALMVWYRFSPDWRILTLPLLIALMVAAAVGTGLWIAALNVKYRDVRYLVPFVVQFGLYVSPVGFSSSLIPDSWRLLYSLNPVVGIIDGFRWALFAGNTPLYWPSLALSCGVALILLFSGIMYFRKTERLFADVI
jgi:homopolymeric O-antigen transport system permease protein